MLLYFIFLKLITDSQKFFIQQKFSIFMPSWHLIYMYNFSIVWMKFSYTLLHRLALLIMTLFAGGLEYLLRHLRKL